MHRGVAGQTVRKKLDAEYEKKHGRGILGGSCLSTFSDVDKRSAYKAYFKELFDMVGVKYDGYINLKEFSTLLILANLFELSDAFYSVARDRLQL